MASEKFNPNRLSFDEGLERIRRATEEAGIRLEGRIFTSRDEGADSLRKALAVSNVPDGFRKYQLPVYLSERSQMFISFAEPDIHTPEHSHDEGDGIRFIAGGSIIYEGKELTAGDWMFIPRGQSYSFDVGPNGALMCYCYCCCCA
ncbi:hypothetical protein GA0070624_4203 [Micromonospora rhizosphaerae]|uniref:Cupin domain-containing protein n=1 Tax=Micromonospora rhizosphaerae TaxID=568872 RepID=A0A1C6SP40_9ACTN|nr:cupin domain-containing protein [Micromonospora rhizosphaerae]SCL31093.1 hypothetical protein GA0070624_4203 [Micromonospora rhizosphaerae]